MKKLLFLILFLASCSLSAGKPGEAEKEEQELSQAFAEMQVSRPPKVHFGPGLDQVLCSLASKEKKGISAALFTFSLYNVAKALVGQKKKHPNFAMDFTVDHGFIKPSSRLEALNLLMQHGAGVFVNTHAGRANRIEFEHMHHKFAIFEDNEGGDPVLVTGSANWTGQSCRQNWENIIILSDAESIAKFQAELVKLAKFRKPITLKQCKSTSPLSSFVRNMNAIPSGSYRGDKFIAS